MHRNSIIVAIVLFGGVSWLSACSGSSTTPGKTDITEIPITFSDIVNGRDVRSKDFLNDELFQSEDLIGDNDSETGPAEGRLGWPCKDNIDCQSGICIESEDGKVCTESCINSCPAGWSCRAITWAGDDIFICLPRFLTLCAPCNKPQDCNPVMSAGGAGCIDNGLDGSFCGGDCSVGDCPRGYTCKAVSLPQGVEKQCVPESGTCKCSKRAITMLASTTCYIKNAAGKCIGTRKCDTMGLTVCTAATPRPEECNKIDDNCNGYTDEGLSHVPCSNSNKFGTCTGTGKCVDGEVIECNARVPAAETCNDIDDNCNGQTDEGVCCTPKTCKDLGKACGRGYTDNCGGVLDCGECNAHEACQDGACVAQAWCGNGKCETAHNETCVTCPADCGCGQGEVCYQNACCTPKTCTDIGKACGRGYADNCGGVLDCGECNAHETCQDGACIAQAWCGNGKCEAAHNETCVTCPADCGTGDGCVPGQTKDLSCGECKTQDWQCGKQCKWESFGSCGPVVNGTLCPDDENFCTSDVCSNGKCIHPKANEAQSCGGSNKFCHEGSCLTGCGISNVYYTSDAINPDNQCQYCDPTSPGGGDVWTNKSNGTSCDDGNKCNGISTCQSGRCQQTTAPVTCNSPPECHTASNATCNAGTGQCTYPVLSNGTSCDDGNKCNGISTCQAGTCTRTTLPVACNNPPECHTASNATCNAGTGQCTYPVLSNNTSCDDGNKCNGISTCQAGSCTQTTPPVSCNSPPTCHTASNASCNAGTGQCTYPNLSNNTQSTGCTGTCQACQNGTCGNASSGTDPGSRCNAKTNYQAGGSPNYCQKRVIPGNCDSSGSCAGYGSWTDINNGKTCGTGKVCDSGSCVAKCYIGGVFYASGATNGPCQYCDPSKSTTGWTNRTNNTQATGCTGTCQACQNGTCGNASSGTDPGSRCNAKTNYQAGGSPDYCQKRVIPGNCDSSGSCAGYGSWTDINNGKTCGTGKVCDSGSCAAKCYIGGVFYASGAANGPCQYCDPAQSTTGWTNRANNTQATGCNGTCQACQNGTCGNASSGSDPGSHCSVLTNYQAGGTPNYCQKQVTPGNCSSSGSCAGYGSWTNINNGNQCNTGKVCNSGSCAAKCYIGGVFYASGAANGPCQYCDPAKSTTGWTNRSNNTQATGCNGTCQACQNGTCGNASSGSDPGSHCSVLTNYQAGGTPNYCQKQVTPGNCSSSGSCAGYGSWTDINNGTTCGSGLVCDSGSCVAKCYISSTFYTNGAANPSNSCQSCQPSKSTTGWSSANEAQSCNAPTKFCHAGSCLLGCGISGVYYTNGTVNPGNQCQYCDSSDGFIWTDTSCNSPSVCQTATGATCDSDTGYCIYPTVPDNTYCGQDAICCADSASTSACVPDVSESNCGTCNNQCASNQHCQSCFVAGTMVRMADGSERPIESIKTGDKVMGFNVKTPGLVPAVVTKTFVHPAKATPYTLIINKSVRATPNHPFFANHKWVRADQLKLGDRIIVLTPVGFKSDTIKSIQRAKGMITTYNLEVDSLHDYFAGGILVHNKFPSCIYLQ